MININNKIWDKLRLKDIEKYLDTIDDDETFFIEFKEENIRNTQLTKEISAFAKSFGGYILLGVNDSKKIVGCSNIWTELKINTIICNGISPTPHFDIKKFDLKNSKKLYIIKVEEGTNPPYITNDGYIYHRVSSSSDRVKDANTLNNLYLRNQNNIKKIEDKIYIQEISGTIPNNLCGYIDFGFSLTSKNIEKTKEKVRKADIEKISEKVRYFPMGFFFRKTKVQLVAPVTGSLISLEQVKDPAFAQKMLGDGVAFLPETGELVAPCDGEISYVPDTAHAIALTEAHGLEILLHIGLNTVEQQGQGFKALVKTGDKVKAGQVLLTFDRDALQARGCDLSTPMVITNGDKVAKLEKGAQGPVSAGKDICLTVTLN